MVAFTFNQDSSSGSDSARFSDPFGHSSGELNGILRGESVSESLVLDNERGELVKAPVRVGKKGVSEAKAMAALKSHSEAERRRRERINAHLGTLRSLLPCAEKMDKATLLGEVISQVKELKKNAIEASRGILVPLDTDEARVEHFDDETGERTFFFRASICCDYRPQLLTDLKQAFDALQLKMVKAEISTLGGRLKHVFLFTSHKERQIDDTQERQLIANSIHQALTSVLEKASSSMEYSPRTTLPNKRRRISLFDSLSSSS